MCYGHSSIPSEIAHLSKLVSLDLSCNYMDDMSMTGRLRLEPHNFKTSLMNLTQLENLHLAQVNISSGLPNSLLNLSSLATLDLSETGLNGKLPDSIGYLGFLKCLDLTENNSLGLFLSRSETSRGLPDYIYWVTILRVWSRLLSQILSNSPILELRLTISMRSISTLGGQPNTTCCFRHFV
ncbi:hypothetical protein RHMOL_Rhmol01G0074600 [Rhododendron molle]|uniref:Uncharacterized protein n=1 Tax=Rhododendron molle TaxID=49168 RepID=A0ACC0PZ89_RHOML|nr:hypothetical protein RHMOL_Rhmol01G0074600 [Rhododendron molle]